MKVRRLGTSELQLSVLGMGCWQYGGGDYWGAQSQKDVDEVVHHALDRGINYFDTAEVYNNGESEISLGISLKGRRHEAVIGSKINTANARPDLLREGCEASLKRLQTDYIDLYMLHWPISPLSIKHFSSSSDLIQSPPTVEEVFFTLQELQREGKIRYIGISNHGVEQMMEVQATGVEVVSNELPYNLISRAIEETILPYCVNQGIGVIGYMPLQQGVLTGEHNELSSVKPMQARSRHFHHSRGTGSRHGEEGAEVEIHQVLNEVRMIAAELNVTMSALCLAWAVANRGITTTIVGSRNAAQLELNAAAASLKLERDVMDRLNRISEPVLAKLGSSPDYYENRFHNRIR
ncbi:aldo/keto reductase [Paenibacillus sp. GD4]|jgi:aryl-alcohol dehydrogenase-like predicted oxidoreductase|uniref:aldo/keto reductase n=1 Tax=Paenibacillus sp. GD4 TaxID=3068890 RepID=UPI0027966FEF|nr:aldo/keto reductase [Paenibacillus sp. GD4]MDQ1909693.1 aldo/keto reductase [Paenibacillus sp. GD4]